MKKSILTLKIAWGALCSFFAILFIHELVYFPGHYSEYPIGESLYWAYSSYENYMTGTVAYVVWGLTGVALCVFPQRKWRNIPLLVHIFVSVIVFLHYRLTL